MSKLLKLILALHLTTKLRTNPIVILVHAFSIRENESHPRYITYVYIKCQSLNMFRYKSRRTGANRLLKGECSKTSFLFRTFSFLNNCLTKITVSLRYLGLPYILQDLLSYVLPNCFCCPSPSLNASFLYSSASNIELRRKYVKEVDIFFPKLASSAEGEINVLVE